MKGTLTFDPYEYDYGPATAAVRQVILDWFDIDWFEPTDASDDEVLRLIEEHNAMAHRLAPALFAERVNAQVVSGGWPELMSWCKRVRAQSRWDWKFSVLKRFAHEHSIAHGWSHESHAATLPDGQPRPGDLFFPIPTAEGKRMLIWNVPLVGPDLATLGRAAESAQFYLGHAQADAFATIEWQLASKSGELNGNPFVPLLHCYRAGGYPFSLDRETVMVFRFHADAAVLPRATLLFGA